MKSKILAVSLLLAATMVATAFLFDGSKKNRGALLAILSSSAVSSIVILAGPRRCRAKAAGVER